MKFSLPEELKKFTRAEVLEIGNVYKCSGGNKTKYWIVIGLTENGVHMLGLDSNGEISSTANYGRHVFESENFTCKGRRLLGRCEELATLTFNITWLEDF